MPITLANMNSPEIWFAFLCGLFLIEAFLLLTFRMFPNFWGDTINIWYDQFGIIAIMLDVLHRPKRKIRIISYSFFCQCNCTFAGLTIFDTNLFLRKLGLSSFISFSNLKSLLNFCGLSLFSRK